MVNRLIGSETADQSRGAKILPKPYEAFWE